MASLKSNDPPNAKLASSSATSVGAGGGFEGRLHEVFAAQPVFTPGALVARLAAGTGQVGPADELANQLVSALPGVAYTFADGPFRSALVRHGYNPCADPGAGSFQTVELPQAWARPPAVRRVGGAPSRAKGAVPLFRTRTSRWQLCDIEDPAAGDVIRAAQAAATRITHAHRIVATYCGIMLLCIGLEAPRLGFLACYEYIGMPSVLHAASAIS